MSKKGEIWYIDSLLVGGVCNENDICYVPMLLYALYAYAVVVCLMCCRQAYHSPSFGHHKKWGDCW